MPSVTGFTAAGTEQRLQELQNQLDIVNSRVFLPPAQMYSYSGGPNLGTSWGGVNWPAWLLDSAVTEGVTGTILVPQDWETADIRLWWSNAGAGVGNVMWGVSRHAIEDGETLAAGTSVLPVLTAPAQVVAKASTVVSGMAVTPGDLMCLRAVRVGGNVADTLPNDAAFLGLELLRAS